MSRNKQAIILFTRVPVAGKTKTRLMPYLTGEECAKLHLCFLKDIRMVCDQCEADLFVCYTKEGEEQIDSLKQVFSKDQKYFLQEGENLGARMKNALGFVLEKNYESCILIGSDIPELHTQCIQKAFEVLRNHDVVFGKTKDGGYYLVGMKSLHKEVFELDTYGHGSVLEETLDLLRKQEVSVGFTDELEDLDTKEDLQNFRKKMRKHKSWKFSATGKYLTEILKISVIIPTYNEEKTIEKLQDQLEPYRQDCEIIFVDGGSTDKTISLIRPHYRVIHSGKGRACQMNEGAKNSQGDILFFLHCDSELPKDFLSEIRCVMRDYEAGCFGIAFHSKHFFMLTCRIISNHRIKDRKVMFGDQGIFVDRDLFFETGMYPEIPIMEDYQFSLSLKEKKVRLGITKHRIYTSDRRFPKKTIPKLRVMWKMNRLRKMYRDGIDIEEIAKRYKDIR